MISAAMIKSPRLPITILKITIRFPLVLAFCTLFMVSASLHGQTNATPASTNAASTNAPTATPPVIAPIALGDIVSQAQSVMAKLREDQSSLGMDQITQIIDENLPVMTRRIDEQAAEDTQLFEASPSLSNLQSSLAPWQSLADSMTTSEEALADRAKNLDAQIARLNQLTKTWQATLDSTTKTAAPPEILQPIKTVLATLADTTKAVQSAQAKVFAVQARVATQDVRISDGLTAVSKAMEIARTQLFQQDHPRLWEVQATIGVGTGIVAQEKVSLYTQLVALKTYLAAKIPAIFIHLMILALLVAVFFWIRRTIKTEAEKEAALLHAARIFDLPVATGTLLALLAAAGLYPDAPRLMWAGVGAVALIPAVIIIRRLIDPANYSLLYATVIAYFVDQLRYVLMPAGILSRFLFIFELLAAAIFLVVALHSKHLCPSGLESDRLKKLTRIYVHVAFFVFVFAGLANVLGYVQLSILVGKGMLDSSYLAVILYAAVRIADALAAAALNIRPLTKLGMVRRHHDLLYENASTSIRWLAFGVWLVVALQFFSQLDLIWKGVGHLLTQDHHWGSLHFQLGPILAFPITVWASFLLSRFIRFALEEEVYPHLQLARGIPYATSTMVHYAILVIGFYLAVKAVGADLTQFTFLAGAFGVGLGFGLQNILNNFVSGIILLFERPIKVGDDIQIDANTVGRVERIGIRASVILLTNGSELIVPNGNLISNPVTNWTLSNCERLIEIPVNVTSKVDPKTVLDLLANVARAHPSVLKNPAPQALLVTFGATLSFRLRAWIDSEEEWMKITSELSLALNSALAKENIAVS